MRTIFLLIPHYIYSSDLLNTKYIKYLSSKYKVIVFLPLSEESLERHGYYKNENIVYISWQIQNKGRLILFRMLRMASVREFDYVTSMKSLIDRFYKEGSRRIKIISIISRCLSKIGLIIKAKYYTKIEELFISESNLFNQYCQQYNPSLILTTTPGFTDMEAEFIILAKKKRIPTVAVNFSWDNLSTCAVRIRKTDYLIAWNNFVKEDAIKIHKYKEKQIFISGAIRFDHYFRDNVILSRNEFLKEKNLDPGLKTILITTVAPGVYRNFPERIKNLLDLIKQGVIKKKVNIFIRIHPKDNAMQYDEFKGIKNLHIEQASKNEQEEATVGFKIEMDNNDLLNLKYTLMYCDLNINYASTISIEACIFDKPVINFCFPGDPPKYYKTHWHYKPLVDKKILRVAYNISEFANLINLYLDNPSIDRENRKEIMKDYIWPTDGNSHKRNVDFLDKIII